MNSRLNKDKIIVIDFGSQVTKLIARRIRDYSVLSEVLTLRDLKNNNIFNNVKGIILSGGPSTVTKSLFPKIPNKIFNLNIPILGICYGTQLITTQFKGKVKANIKKREFGRVTLFEKKKSLLTKNFFKKGKSFVWMSHQDTISKLPKGFLKIASTNQSTMAIIENKKKNIYGIQFHPEVTHTHNGDVIKI
jgi:GMP synthase (glutamine-hydrolysing)